MRVDKFILVLLFAVMFGLGGHTATSAEPVKIRIAWIAAPTNLPPILFAKQGIAKHLGQSYTMEPIRFQSSPQMITAISAGELEIGLLGFSTFALAVQNAGLDDLRVIADDFQDGFEDYFSDQFLVRKDSPVTKIADLKGKILATNGLGSATDIAMRVILRQNKLEDKKDFTILEVALPNMKAVLSERKVDMIPGVIPFARDPELMALSRTLFVQKDSMGTTQVLLWAARASFLQKNRAALVDFLEDVVRARHFYLDPANHKEAVEIVTNFTKQPANFFDSWVFTKQDTYRDPMAVPNLEAMQSNVRLAHEFGFLKADLDVKRYADLSIVKEAGQRLK